MSTATSPDALMARVTCPHCWEVFPPEEVVWVSEHSDLLGDPLLGPEQAQRFLPSRFTIKGEAIDAKGMTCRVLACPKCHLSLPRCALEMPTLFLSILGSPASGKSYFLATMIHELRKVLPANFAINIADVDPMANRLLNEAEENLFFNTGPDDYVPLGNLIRKTELEGELYETVAYGNQTIAYPKPFLFDLRPGPGNNRVAEAVGMGQLLCLYDNAGEHFLPGRDTTATPVTRHLAHSRALMFVLDPMQDQRVLAALSARKGASEPVSRGRTSRQETILLEAAARIRRHSGLLQSEKHPRPLVIVLTKLDQWESLLDDPEGDDHSEPSRSVPSLNQNAIDIERIERRSARLRKLLQALCPEIVSSAEGFAQEVFYIATSALGDKIGIDPKTGYAGIRPRDIQPRWVTVPLLYIMAKTLSGFVPRFRRKTQSPRTNDPT